MVIYQVSRIIIRFHLLDHRLQYWTVDDVTMFLNKSGLSQYSEKFRADAIDGTALCYSSQAVIERFVTDEIHKWKLQRLLAEFSN